MMNKNIFLIICLTVSLYTCGPQQSSTPPQTPDSPEQPASKVEPNEEIFDDPMSMAKDSILGILERYYAALEAEQVDETQFFAPNVKKFYNQTNQAREKIGQSIKNGFQGVENRNIDLDPSSLEVSTTTDGFVVEFEGEVDLTRTSDKSKVQERFRNRVGFNQNFQITSYEALEIDKPTARKLEPASRDAIAAEAVMQALATGDKDIISNFIHPNLGFYYVTRPGAMSSVKKCNHINEVFDNSLTPYSKDRFQKMNCELQVESLPEYDCETFSKEGCFMAEVTSYDAVSQLMQNLNSADLGEFSSDDLSIANQLESNVIRHIVATSALTALYLGEIDGQWYLLVIDIASYDCSA